MSKIDRLKWPKCEKCNGPGLFVVEAKEYRATSLNFAPEPKEGKPTLSADGDDSAEIEVRFCPWCARPLTDEAAKMLQERLQEFEIAE